MFLRKLLVSANVIIGGILFLGAGLFAWMGAGTYGSPFAGDDFFNMTLLGVLVFGPMALLPTTFLEISKPRWGGFLLCISALLCTGSIWMNNQFEWGFAVYNFWTATASIAIPLFLVGCYYIKSAKHADSKHVILSTDEPEVESRLVVNAKSTEKNRMYIG